MYTFSHLLYICAFIAESDVQLKGLYKVQHSPTIGTY